MEALPVAWWMSSLPDDHPLRRDHPGHQPCVDGQRWEWEGVTFTLLHPLAEKYANRTRKTNDMSCVLRVDTAAGRSLITSDIEALSEREILARHRADLRADLLLVPHHGSRTSSTEDFIAAVGAREAAFPVGYRNRFGHPKEDVVQRYAASGAALHRTDSEGALSYDFSAAGLRLETERDNRRRYWHGR
jgi:competence protein ComEC